MIQITKEIKNGKNWYYVHLPFITELTEKELTELYLKICEHLFDNLLEQNKDLLQRLKNNEPAPKTLNADEVIMWMRNRHRITPNGVCYCLSIDDIQQFKKDFGL